MSETPSVRPVVTILVLLVDLVWYNFCIICTLLTNLTLVLNLVYNGSFTPETQEQLKKISTARLAAKLGRAWYDPDRLEDLERKRSIRSPGRDHAG